MQQDVRCTWRRRMEEETYVFSKAAPPCGYSFWAVNGAVLWRFSASFGFTPDYCNLLATLFFWGEVCSPVKL